MCHECDALRRKVKELELYKELWERYVPAALVEMRRTKLEVQDAVDEFTRYIKLLENKNDRKN